MPLDIHYALKGYFFQATVRRTTGMEEQVRHRVERSVGRKEINENYDYITNYRRPIREQWIRKTSYLIET